MKRMTFDEFKVRAVVVHGNRYRYFREDYVNASTKTKIVCPEHGVFYQAPTIHLKGCGCKQCGYKAAREKADYEARTRKREQTFMERHGVTNPMQMISAREKLRETCMLKYGVENAHQNKDVIERAKRTNLEKYGATAYAASVEGKARIEATNEARYGAKNFMQSDAYLEIAADMQDKSRQTQIERYGVPHYSQSEEAKARRVDRKNKEIASKLENGTFNTSQPEDVMYRRLVECFGTADVARNYKDDVRYPFYCDFYIKSRDMFIELNIHWTHGKHPFGLFSSDTEIAKMWADKDDVYYQNAIQTWTVRDVMKFDVAREHHLNYLVFWRPDLWDIDLWFALGCPDGQDYDAMYSYLPDRQIVSNINMPKKKLTQHTIMYTAKRLQFAAFYKKELKWWNTNGELRRSACHMPVQAYLYQNRFHYLGKTPERLSDFEILQGFKIAGISKGYTSFDSSMLLAMMEKYGITSVYDPCAGWGERLLSCELLGSVSYDGVDINKALADGYDEIVDGTHTIRFGDSAMLCPLNDIDAFVACPPYGSLEKYTDDGAENLAPAAFSLWWRQVCENAAPYVKCYVMIQTNRKYRDVFLAPWLDMGCEPIDELQQHKRSHFGRMDGHEKREFESLIVLKKRI